jgi:predicted MPP superfamily phosphohydrolase
MLMVPALWLVFAGDVFRLDVPLRGGESRSPSFWRLASAVWVVGSCGAFGVGVVLRLWDALRRRRLAAEPRPADSTAVLISRRAALAAPFAVAGYGVFIERERFGLSEIEMAVPNLPPDLEGLRIGQITDIHAGPFLEPKDLRRVVAMLNETRPHVTMITGDLITREGDPLHETIDVLSGLRADAGLWGCMGNHEQFARCRGEAQVYGREKGIEFLRQSRRILRFGDAKLNVAGVDYQRVRDPYLVGAEQWLEPGAVNLLLSHNPDVFPVAAKLGYDLVLSGHTHGGQITLEIVEQTVNPGRFLTPFVSGLYEIGAASIYVSRGLGTVTLPMRMGARPEAAVIRLRRA